MSVSYNYRTELQLLYPGETMSFSVLIQGEGKNNLKYKWTVDKGTIVEGEETTVVQVSTEGLKIRHSYCNI